MRNPAIRSPRPQRGAVLVVALIMLAVMTLFVISMLKTAVIDLKIGGASQVASINLANADSAVENYLGINNGLFAPNFLTLAAGAGGPLAGSNAYAAYGGSAAVAATQISCGAFFCYGCQYGATNLQAVQFDLRSTATGSAAFGSTGTTAVVHQGVTAVAAAGSC